MWDGERGAASRGLLRQKRNGYRLWWESLKKKIAGKE